MARPRKKPREPHSGRMKPELRRAVKRFAGPVGELVWAYNMAHTGFALVFAKLIEPSTSVPGIAGWNSLRNDKAQRDLLIALCEVSAEPFAKEVKWAAEKVDNLSLIRNDGVHMGPGIDTDAKGKSVIVPVLLSNPESRIKRLKKHADITRLFRRAGADLYRLSFFLFSIWAALDKNEPLPRRPRLRLTQAEISGDVPTSRPKRKTQKSRHQPSRG